MIELLFASNNEHKAEEIRSVTEGKIKILTLKQVGIDIDIPEPFESIEANASEKSKVIYGLTGRNCFSEDTGLEVDALNGEPGVKSARYAGNSKDFNKNIEKLLQNLRQQPNRNARFRTVISLIINNEEHLFEGISEGTISHISKGGNGFGYDQVFVPANSYRTFAEMSLEEKNEYSHRRKATCKLVSFLQHEHTDS